MLEDKRIYPVGSTEGIFSDFRLICATNVDLSMMVREGLFRQDLYFRIIVIHLELPPVRERGEKDIEYLVRHFLREFGDYIIDNRALDLLRQYSWPGNVRELKNLIRKFVIIAQEGGIHSITLDMVKEGFKKSHATDNVHYLIKQLLDHCNGNIATIIKKIEDTGVLKAFKDNNGNLSKTAQQLFRETPDDTKDHRDKVRRHSREEQGTAVDNPQTVWISHTVSIVNPPRLQCSPLFSTAAKY